MLRFCCIGHQVFEDDVEIVCAEEEITLLKTYEQIACKKCYEELEKLALYTIKKFKEESNT